MQHMLGSPEACTTCQREMPRHQAPTTCLLPKNSQACPLSNRHPARTVCVAPSRSRPDRCAGLCHTAGFQQPLLPAEAFHEQLHRGPVRPLQTCPTPKLPACPRQRLQQPMESTGTNLVEAADVTALGLRNVVLVQRRENHGCGGGRPSAIIPAPFQRPLARRAHSNATTRRSQPAKTKLKPASAEPALHAQLAPHQDPPASHVIPLPKSIRTARRQLRPGRHLHPRVRAYNCILIQPTILPASPTQAGGRLTPEEREHP